MSKKNCDLVKDLLPLYAENMCSEESCKTVAAHLADCAACSEELKKMKTEVRVKADDDIAVIKKIRRKIRIAKVVVGVIVGAVVMFCLWLLAFWLLNTPEEMDYNRYGLAENVTVELDDNGDLWLVRQGIAQTADGVYMTRSDENGNHFGDGSFDKETKCGIGYTLMQRKIDRFAYADLSGEKPIRMLICNINENDVQYVFYYEAEANVEHVIWTRS